jgi:voltage-gated potassium channel
MKFRQTQFYRALMLLAITYVGSGVGYYLLGLGNPGGPWSLFDCYYMSTITLTTVGFSETLRGMDAYPAARAYTMVLLIFGTSFLVYAASAGAAFIVEGQLGSILGKRKMLKEIHALDGHFIVCGAGSTGVNVVRELIATGKPFVAVELDEERVRRARELGARLVIQGDATSDEVLMSAGITHASALATCLSDDRDNVFVTVTAHELNRNLRIIAKNVDPSARDKLIRAGASAVVSPSLIGGLRLASELIRPAVVTFLDFMLRDKGVNVRFAEVTVGARSELAGRTLGEARIQERVGLPVLALRPMGAADFQFNPGPGERLEPGIVIVVMGPLAQVQALERLAGG